MYSSPIVILWIDPRRSPARRDIERVMGFAPGTRHANFIIAVITVITAMRRKYCMAKSTLVLFKGDDGFVAKPIPEGSIIAFDPDNLVSGKLIEVVWEDESVLMFASDLKNFTRPE